ncbi:MAG: hypothetical protein IJV35_04400 [Neisseriaceae bacterium]|nr:hypothetical protein [Neisseriaceae bacterium]
MGDENKTYNRNSFGEDGLRVEKDYSTNRMKEIFSKEKAVAAARNSPLELVVASVGWATCCPRV